MLELTADQWVALCANDERNFVATIRDDIVRDAPRYADDPTLLDRLVRAYADAKRMGFQQDKELVEFLYIEADVPEFYRKPGIAAWLAKPGRPVEERFEDLLAVTRRKLIDREREKR
jgi:hypothetical protein